MATSKGITIVSTLRAAVAVSP